MRSNEPHPNVVDVSACTCANLRKATRAVTQFYEAALQPAGLKATQFTILATLGELGEPALTQFAKALVMDRTTLTRNLRPLEKDGLIVVEPDIDRRVRKVRLTGKGERTLKAALPLWRKAQRDLVGGLGEPRWAGLLNDLTTAIGHVQGN